MSYLYQDAEQYINETFWRDSHDSRSTLNVPALIEARLIADNKAKDPEYYSHREGVVHVTSIAKCLRGVIYEMLGHASTTEIEPRKLGVFQAGNLFEDYIVGALSEKIIERQREYNYKYKNIMLVGRNDGVIEDDGVKRIIECKSVHTESFWMRQKEGTLIAWHNQIQLQVYMWLERELFGNNWDAELIYVSKDDCMVASSPLKYNPDIIEKIVKPALDIINDGYTKKDPNVAPVPPMVVYSKGKGQYQRNWLCTYCNHHTLCAGAGWVLEAQNLVKQRNRELKESMPSEHTKKKGKTAISVVEDAEPEYGEATGDVQS